MGGFGTALRAGFGVTTVIPLRADFPDSSAVLAAGVVSVLSLAFLFVAAALEPTADTGFAAAAGWGALSPLGVTTGFGTATVLTGTAALLGTADLTTGAPFASEAGFTALESGLVAEALEVATLTAKAFEAGPLEAEVFGAAPFAVTSFEAPVLDVEPAFTVVATLVFDAFAAVVLVEAVGFVAILAASFATPALAVDLAPASFLACAAFAFDPGPLFPGDAFAADLDAIAFAGLTATDFGVGFDTVVPDALHRSHGRRNRIGLRQSLRLASSVVENHCFCQHRIQVRGPKGMHSTLLGQRVPDFPCHVRVYILNLYTPKRRFDMA